MNPYSWLRIDHYSSHSTKIMSFMRNIWHNDRVSIPTLDVGLLYWNFTCFCSNFLIQYCISLCVCDQMITRSNWKFHSLKLLSNSFSICLSYNINWNYGLLPQTWEDPSLANSEVEGAFGDNDPGILLYTLFITFELPNSFMDCCFTWLADKLNIYWYFLQFVVDVVEIGESRAKIGQILRVKPLGALAMIDEGELDWKIVAISLDDPRASLVNDVDDVEKHFPVRLFLPMALFFLLQTI